MRWNMVKRLYAVVGGMSVLACAMVVTGITAARSGKADGDHVIAPHASSVLSKPRQCDFNGVVGPAAFRKGME
jgi:hypothetical protein